MCQVFTFFILICWNQFLLYIGSSFHPIKLLPSISVSFPLITLALVGKQKLFTGFPSWHLSPLLDSGAAVRDPPLLAEEFSDHDVTSWRTPAWIKTEEMNGEPSPGNKLIKSSRVKAKEIKENRGQSYNTTTIVCISIPHLFNEYYLSSDTESDIVPSLKEFTV